MRRVRRREGGRGSWSVPALAYCAEHPGRRRWRRSRVGPRRTMTYVPAATQVAAAGFRVVTRTYSTAQWPGLCCCSRWKCVAHTRSDARLSTVGARAPATGRLRLGGARNAHMYDVRCALNRPWLDKGGASSRFRARQCAHVRRALNRPCVASVVGSGRVAVGRSSCANVP